MQPEASLHCSQEPAPCPFLRHMKRRYTLPWYFFTIYYNIILLSVQVASVSYFSSPHACLYFSSQDLRNPRPKNRQNIRCLSHGSNRVPSEYRVLSVLSIHIALG